jgi:hypothetical protein
MILIEGIGAVISFFRAWSTTESKAHYVSGRLSIFHI